MLFLTGATVGVFVAQDLLLFYAFFEAMLIPLYVLVGVWGGPGRLGATVKFVIYTMAGSLLMLAALIVYGLQVGTFDLVDGPTSASRWIFLGFMFAFVIKAPLFPFHGWLPGRVPRGAAGGDRRAVGRDREGGRLRDAADRDHEVPRADVVLPDARSSRSRAARARVRLACSRSARRLPRRRRVLVARAVRA